MTKELLEAYQKNKQTVKLIETELSDMTDTDAGLGSSVIVDYRTGQPRPQAIVGFDWQLYDYRANRLERLNQKNKEVEDWVNNIPDERARCVFQQYYLQGRTWSQIARMIGLRGNPDYPRLHIRDKYLKDLGII